MNDMADSKGTLVTGVIGEDVHIMGIRIVEHALRDAGFRIVSLGAQVSQEQYHRGRDRDKCRRHPRFIPGWPCQYPCPGITGKM